MASSSECNICLDSDHHKEQPGPEAELFNVCSPWKGRSCCTKNTSYEAHTEGDDNTYGFVFSHCSSKQQMSDKCKRHFIEDNCFYECSPNVGPWIVNEGNSYRDQRYRDVPLCSNTCLSWWEDCKEDYTCKENWSTGWDWSTGKNVCPAPAGEGACKKFKEIFPTSTELCEKIYPGDFKVVAGEDPCFVMWFDGTENPNDKVKDYYLDQGKTCGGSEAQKSLANLICIVCFFQALLSF